MRVAGTAPAVSRVQSASRPSVAASASTSAACRATTASRDDQAGIRGPDVRNAGEIVLRGRGPGDDVRDQLVTGGDRLLARGRIRAVERGQRGACLRAERVDLVGQRPQVSFGCVESRGHLGVAGRGDVAAAGAARVGWSMPVTIPAAPSAMRDQDHEPDHGRRGSGRTRLSWRRRDGRERAGDLVAPLRPEVAERALHRPRLEAEPRRDEVERADVVEPELAQLVRGDRERQVDELAAPATSG